MNVTTKIRRMAGRDPSEEGRAATSLEVFYDLVFVVAFSISGGLLAEYLTEGHFRTAVVGYVFVTFAAVWAWINFAWFASAFDTDDWIYRLLTLVQMVGVAIIAIGMPEAFSSIDANAHVDIAVVVIGYVVMRAGLIVQWLRAAYEASAYRATCLTYALMMTIAQVGWIIVAIIPLTLLETLGAIVICVFIELLGPAIAEGRFESTPWNAGHIVERYSTLVVITLGEGVVGTVAVLQAVIGRSGWTFQTAVLGLAAMGVTFAMWWLYFQLDGGRALAEHPNRSFAFGYGTIVIFGACAAVGAGLHVMAKWMDNEAHISTTAVFSAVAIPLALFCLGAIAMYYFLAGIDKLMVPLVVVTAIPLVAGTIMVVCGASPLASVVVACFAPVFAVVVLELTSRWRHARDLRRVSAGTH